MTAASFIFVCNENSKELSVSIVGVQNTIGYKRNGNGSVQLVVLEPLYEAELLWRTSMRFLFLKEKDAQY
jgi:hypothetical protein